MWFLVTMVVLMVIQTVMIFLHIRSTHKEIDYLTTRIKYLEEEIIDRKLRE